MRVVYLLGVLCVGVAVAAPQPNAEDNDIVYGKEITAPSDRKKGESKFDELRRIMKEQRAAESGNKDSSENSDDDDATYGRVIYSPSERNQPNSRGQFDVLREKLRETHRGEKGNKDDDSDTTDKKDGDDNDYVYGKVVYTRPDGKAHPKPIEILRDILRESLPEALETAAKAREYLSEDEMRIIDDILAQRQKGEDDRRKEDAMPSDQEYRPEDLKMLSQTLASLMNNIIRTGNLPIDPLPFKTDPDYTGMIDSMMAAVNEVNKMAEAASMFKRNKRSANDDTYHGDYDEDKRNDNPKMGHDVVNKRSADEPLYPELQYRDAKKKRSIDALRELLKNDKLFKLNSKTKYFIDKLLEMSDDQFYGPDDDIRHLIDIRRKRTVDNLVSRSDHVDKEKLLETSDDQFYGPDDDILHLIDIRRKRTVDNLVSGGDHVEKEKLLEMSDDQFYGPDDDILHLIDIRRKRTVNNLVSGGDHVEKEKLLEMSDDQFYGPDDDIRHLIDIRRKRTVDNPVSGGDHIEKESFERRRRSDDTHSSEVRHEVMDKIPLAKRSIVEKDAPLPPFDNTESSDITQSGDLILREKRAADDAGHSVSNTNDEDDTFAQERESFFVPAILHEIDTSSSRYVPINLHNFDVDYVHNKEGRILASVDYEDDETESSDAKLKVLNRSRRDSDVPPDSKFMKEVTDVKETAIPHVDMLPLPLDEAVHTMMREHYNRRLPPRQNMDDEAKGYPTRQSNTVRDKMARRNIRTDVKSKDTVIDHDPSPLIQKAVRDPVNFLDKTISIPSNAHRIQHTEPVMIVVPKPIHKPIHSVVDEMIDYDDSLHKQTLAEVGQQPDTENKKVPDNSVSENVDKQGKPEIIIHEQKHVDKTIHSVVEDVIAHNKNVESSHVIVTAGAGNGAGNVLPDLTAVDTGKSVNTPDQSLPDTVVESAHIRVNDKEMKLDMFDEEVATSSSSAPEITVSVTEPTVPVTQSTVSVKEDTVPVTTSEPVSVSTGLPVHQPKTEVKDTMEITPLPLESSSTTVTPTVPTIVDITGTTPSPTTERTTQISEISKSKVEKGVNELIPMVTVLVKDAVNIVKERKGENDPRDSRGPHLFPGVAPTAETSVPTTNPHRIVPPIGFEEIADHKRRVSTSVRGPTFTDHPVVSIFDVTEDKIEENHHHESGPSDKRISTHNKGRGGNKKNRGGYDDKHIDCDYDHDTGYGKGHGGYDRNGGGYDRHRGGYDKHRGGYDKNCGGYDKHRGGYDKHRGGYDKHRGGYDKHRGGYYDDCDDNNSNEYDDHYDNSHSHDYDDDNDSGYDDHHGHDRYDDNRSGCDDSHSHDYDDDNHSGYDDHHHDDYEDDKHIRYDDYDDYGDDFSGYNKNRGGYDKNCGGYGKKRGGCNKNRGGYGPVQGGFKPNRAATDKKDSDYDSDVALFVQYRGLYKKDDSKRKEDRVSKKNRGGFNKDCLGEKRNSPECKNSRNLGGYKKTRGGSSKKSGGYTNYNGNVRSRGGYDKRLDKYDQFYKDCDNNNGGYGKNRGGHNKNGGSPNRDKTVQHRGFINKNVDPYVEYEEGHHGGPGDFHLVPGSAKVHARLSKRNVIQNGDSFPVKGEVPEVGMPEVRSSIAEPKALLPDVSIPKFELPTPLVPEVRKRPQIGDVMNPDFMPQREISPDKIWKPLPETSWDPNAFRPKPQPPHSGLPPFATDPSDDKPKDLDKGAYWHKLEIPFLGFEHEVQIQPIHKLKNLLFPKTIGKKDESFKRVKLGPWSMRVGLEI